MQPLSDEESRLAAAPGKTGGARGPGTDQAKKAFLANLRHELKTPVNAILGYSEMLLEDAGPTGHGDCIADLEKINTAGKRLLGLINDVLDPVKVEASGLDISSEAFGARVKHELRIPLNAVIGYSELLLEGMGEVGPNDFISDVQKIKTAGGRLLGLLDDIVRLSKMEAGKMDVALEDPGPSLVMQNVATAVSSLTYECKGPSTAEKGSVLVIDDNETNRDMLSRLLTRQGCQVCLAENGRQGLASMESARFDLVLLDIMMPGMNGYQVLEILKTSEKWRHVPVIMISALDEMESVTRCIGLGAADYLPKPFNPVLLRARVNASLAEKRLYDMEQAYLKQIQEEQEKSERLLLNILPAPIAARLKQGEKAIADSFPEATVLFADMVGFTSFAARRPSSEVVETLNVIFSAFDHLAETHQLEKIKTIGDAYMVVGGVPVPRSDHAEAVAAMALDMQAEVARINKRAMEPLPFRIGFHSGQVIAGIIGTKKFAYDLWGDTVNTASRMESHSVPGGILASEETYLRLKDKYTFQPHGLAQLDARRKMMAYLLTGFKR